MRARIARGERPAILFGRERWGLTNDEISRSDVIVTAPVNPAFASRHVEGLVPKFQELANELIDGFIADGQCEFMHQFSEPYATRVICRLLGVSDGNWEDLALYAEKMSLALSIAAKERLDEVAISLEGAGEEGRRLGAEALLGPVGAGLLRPVENRRPTVPALLDVGDDPAVGGHLAVGL